MVLVRFQTVVIKVVITATLLLMFWCKLSEYLFCKAHEHSFFYRVETNAINFQKLFRGLMFKAHLSCTGKESSGQYFI